MQYIYARIQRRVRVEPLALVKLVSGTLEKGQEIEFQVLDIEGIPLLDTPEEGVIWEVDPLDNSYYIVPKEGQF